VKIHEKSERRFIMGKERIFVEASQALPSRPSRSDSEHVGMVRCSGLRQGPRDFESPH
jgi:hypothetical protein